MDLDGRGGGEKLGRVEEEETITRIYYLRKKSNFKKGENIHTKSLPYKVTFLSAPGTQARHTSSTTHHVWVLQLFSPSLLFQTTIEKDVFQGLDA